MLNMEEWMDIKGLKREGHSIREVARRTGRSRNTVRKVLRNNAQEKKRRKRKSSILDPYGKYLKGRYEETGLSAVRLLEEIEGMGYEGSVDTVRRYLRELDEETRAVSKATVRFETPPGKQAQVDWTEIGVMPDEFGISKKVYAFVMILGFSRMMYIEFTRSMKLDVLIECHENAFSYFGGTPQEILYDNMAQVRLPMGKLNPKMVDYLGHYGVTLKTHRPYRARTKGKVERSVHYVKDNFIKGREFEGFEDLQTKGRIWTKETANKRTHATTGRVPFEQLKEEGLIPLSRRYQKRAQAVTRKVNAEGYVMIGGSRYSVPPRLVGKRVTVRSAHGRINVLDGDVIVAEHSEALKKGEAVIDPEHASAMWKLTLEASRPPKAPGARLLVSAPETRPLSVYEEVSNAAL